MDAGTVLGALGRSAVPATRLLRRLGAERGALRSLRRLLERLEEEGRAERVSGGWRRTRPDGLVEGEVLSAQAARGGLARDEAGREWRLADLEGAGPGDRVLLAPGTRGRGLLVEVIPAERDRWVGILRRHGKWLGIGPYRDDGDWFVRVARPDAGGAEPGEVVAAVPVPRKGRRRSAREGEPWARVVERLGRPGEPDADTAAVVWRHRLRTEFPPEVRAEAAALREPDRAVLAARADLRERPFVTIDPATARDHDDAVCVEETGEGFLLEVAIADVAHFVPAGSALDREARLRGNSVYFPDRAIPMLPERLSSELCSLVPEVDRLALVVELAIARDGTVGRRRFRPAVIRSRARLVYEEAAALMQDGADAPHAPMLRRLDRLAGALRRRRLAAGSLDFDLPQPRFTLDARGHPVDARPEPRTAAHRAIEEAMLAANRAVAEHLEEAEVAAVHRIHEPPAPSDLERLLGELTALGLFEGGAPESLTARELGRALARAEGGPAERWIHQLALRSMRRARYDARSQPHFALAFEHYLHFTSPIRRYADLAVHRALRALLAGDAPALGPGEAESVALRSSHRERVAMAAEREMEQIESCVLLRDHLGERHAGAVTGLAPHGLYVTLDAWWVEGLVHASRLPGFYELEEGGRALVGPGGRFRLGDRVAVEIAAADPVSARIDFDLVREERSERARSTSASTSQPAGSRTRRPSRVRKHR